MFEQTIAERVRPLAEAFHDGGLLRLRVADGDFEAEFRRTAARTTVAEPVGAAAAPVRPAEPIVSDAVGVVRFLRPPVAEGQTIEGDRELAYVETLGMRNPVRSQGTGRVVAVYVTEGQPVEYGQPLFALER